MFGYLMAHFSGFDYQLNDLSCSAPSLAVRTHICENTSSLYNVMIAPGRAKRRRHCCFCLGKKRPIESGMWTLSVETLRSAKVSYFSSTDRFFVPAQMR